MMEIEKIESKSILHPARSPRQTERLTEIEGIRGILVLIVVLSHFGLDSLIDKLTGGVVVRSFWGNAVDFFFIISGYVLASSHFRHERSWFAFAVSRCFRLLPAYLFLLVVFIPHEWGKWSDMPTPLLLSLPGLSYLLGLPQWNGVSWSMSLELYFPLLLAPIFLLLVRSFGFALVAFAVCLVGSSLMANLWPLSDIPNGPLRGFFGIGLGVSLFLIAHSFPSFTFLPFGRFSACFFFSLYLLVTFLSEVLAPIGVLVPSLAVLTVLSCRGARSILSSNGMVWLGGLTYTIYLVHMPLFVLSIDIFGKEVFEGNAVVKLAVVCASISMAWIVTKLVERPMNKIGHNLAARFSGVGVKSTKGPA